MEALLTSVHRLVGARACAVGSGELMEEVVGERAELRVELVGLQRHLCRRLSAERE